MPGRSTDLFTIPDPFWQLPAVAAALRERDIGKLLLLVHEHTKASQTQIAIACGKTQPKINALMRGKARVEELSVYEEYANGLGMPGHARQLLGLAPDPEPPTDRPARRPRALVIRPAPAPRQVDEPDMIASAAAEAAADRLRLAAESGPEALELLHSESLEIARAEIVPL
jgi:predicted XRE-type DNA-binding protein